MIIIVFLQRIKQDDALKAQCILVIVTFIIYYCKKKKPKMYFVFNGITRFSLAGPMEWNTGLLIKISCSK